MTDLPEVAIYGSEDGVAIVQCRREACMVPHSSTDRERGWLWNWYQEAPYAATLDQVGAIIAEHLATHADHVPVEREAGARLAPQQRATGLVPWDAGAA